MSTLVVLLMTPQSGFCSIQLPSFINIRFCHVAQKIDFTLLNSGDTLSAEIALKVTKRNSYRRENSASAAFYLHRVSKKTVPVLFFE